MFKEKFSTISLARAGIIAALYIAVSFLVMPISSGAIQIRVSEALTMLAVVLPESIPALFIGCALANLITGCAPYDIIFGSLITLIGGVLTFFTTKNIKSKPLKIFIGGLFPVLLNAFLLPLIWKWCYGFLDYIYIVQVLLLLAGQTVSVYALGTPLYLTVDKFKQKGVKFFD